MTRLMIAAWVLTVGFSAGLEAMPQLDESTQSQGPDMEQVLDAMDRTSTWGHPDLSNEFAGMHRIKTGHYQSAMRYLKQSAWYADKLSQLSVGLMYLNGQGVAKNPVSAFAWVAVSAERKYPRFLATRDAIWASLDEAQREQATRLVGELYAQYGDPVAKRRMVRALNQAKSQMAGSLLGFGTSSVYSVAPDGKLSACGKQTIDGAAQIGCGNIYADWLWDPKKYFEARDGAWKGTVSVGALTTTGEAAGTRMKTHDARSDISQ